MKIDVSKIDEEQFFIRQKVIANESVFLIYPRPNVIWTKENLVLRSSVWNQDGELISASYQKFFNWSERPDINPQPESISECQLIEKIDGSTLILSSYKGELITRTRGSIDTSNCDKTDDEISLFKKKYPKVFKNDEKHSFIYEWVTPANRIVLEYQQPKLFLTGVIRHSDYSMLTQGELDRIALDIGVERPKVFEFSNIDEMINTIKGFKGIEGICVYYNNGQSIRKLKTEEYLLLHSFKYNLNLENVLDMFLRYGCPNYDQFIEKIAQEFDWECAQFIKEQVLQICNASIEVNKIIDDLISFAKSIKHLSRKEAAEKAKLAYSSTKRWYFVFKFLDNKEIYNDELKELYMNVLKG